MCDLDAIRSEVLGYGRATAANALTHGAVRILHAVHAHDGAGADVPDSGAIWNELSDDVTPVCHKPVVSARHRERAGCWCPRPCAIEVRRD
jgi:hypothetical protein